MFEMSRQDGNDTMSLGILVHHSRSFQPLPSLHRPISHAEPPHRASAPPPFSLIKGVGIRSPSLECREDTAFLWSYVNDVTLCDEIFLSERGIDPFIWSRCVSQRRHWRGCVHMNGTTVCSMRKWVANSLHLLSFTRSCFFTFAQISIARFLNFDYEQGEYIILTLLT